MSLKLRKLDLHVHSPASHDFNGKAATADEIVDHCQKQGLDAIAVTDHNTADFVDLMKEAAAKKGFTVFPGIEISCGGSQNGSIHVIALFDPTATKDDLQKVLGALDVKGKGEESLTAKSVSDVVDIVRDMGGLPVLAHANSAHGALSDIKGNPRTELVKNKNLCAVEATAGDFAKPEGKRLVDYLNGNDPTYQRKLAVYKSSDNRSPDDKGHCVASIGSGYTYFKMGALTLESLRQCFEDPDSRIVQDYETAKINSDHPRIETIEITGGFLDKQKVAFHSGMNSIIGGTGTGKSLAIEFLRFVLDRPPLTVLLSDHKEKLQKQLRINSEVKVTIKDGTGVEYEVSRKYENAREPYTSAITCINKSTGKEFKGDLSSIFPVLVYSQNEILEITRDPDAQLRLLDNFRDFGSHQHKVDEITQSLETLDRQLLDAIQGSANLGTLTKQQQNVDESLEKLEKKIGASGTKGVKENFLKLVQERNLIEAKIEEFDVLLGKIDETIEEFEADAPTRKKTPKELIDIVEADISDNYMAAAEVLRKHRAVVEKSKKKAESSLVAWDKEKKYTDADKKYKDEIKLEKKEETFETERSSLTQEKKELGAKIAAADKAAKQYEKVRKERAEKLSKLQGTKDAYFTERSKQAELITNKSGGKLKIVVQSGDNKAIYLQMLKKLKVGSHAEKKEVEEIAKSVSPIDLVNLALDKDAKKLASLAHLTEQKAESIINELLDQANLLETLSMQYRGFPEDRIEISYQKKDGNYYPLSELSMGQKADALIMIALGDGIMPVIIDQPEDALDIPSIWGDICSRLRISKHARQFVFTTHNSSISVSSDSDQYIVLEADGTKGWVAHSGSIDQQNVKDEIVGHLEGGYSSYDLKRKKYGL